jgi:c-di-GMP-binding flagellar brake protein YcgR
MKIELISTEDRGRYLVSHAAEIERILREVMDDKNIVALYGETSKQFLLSTLVEINAAKGYLLFEQGVDVAMNALLLAGKECTFASTHDQVHIQFSSGGIESAKLGQEDLFRVPMPKELLRLQRREYYRLVTSVINPVKCLINTGAGLMESVVVDISIGGVGVLSYPEVGSLKAGETYHGCRITLPGTGEFAVGLKVCTTFEITLKNGRLTHRAGCQFIDLPASVETAIQRYIIQVDRERRARYA